MREIYNRYLLNFDARRLQSITLDGQTFLQPHLLPHEAHSHWELQKLSTALVHESQRTWCISCEDKGRSLCSGKKSSLKIHTMYWGADNSLARKETNSETCQGRARFQQHRDASCHQGVFPAKQGAE